MWGRNSLLFSRRGEGEISTQHIIWGALFAARISHNFFDCASRGEKILICAEARIFHPLQNVAGAQTVLHWGEFVSSPARNFFSNPTYSSGGGQPKTFLPYGKYVPPHNFLGGEKRKNFPRTTIVSPLKRGSISLSFAGERKKALFSLS